MIYVIAKVELVAGKRSDYLNELNKVRSHVCNESGCLQYGPAIDVATDITNQDPINENTVTIIEGWTDVDALKAHLTAPHMQSYHEAAKDYVKQITIKVLKPVWWI
jgi:quinol monooxygenase YgiN